MTVLSSVVLRFRESLLWRQLAREETNWLTLRTSPWKNCPFAQLLMYQRYDIAGKKSNAFEQDETRALTRSLSRKFDIF